MVSRHHFHDKGSKKAWHRGLGVACTEALERTIGLHIYSKRTVNSIKEQSMYLRLSSKVQTFNERVDTNSHAKLA
jgi:hypothetical protein